MDDKYKLLLIIIFLAYFIISILQFIGLMSLSNFYAFALAFSSILLSISELIVNITKYYYYVIDLSIDINHLNKECNFDKSGFTNGRSNTFYMSICKKYGKRDYGDKEQKMIVHIFNFFLKLSILFFSLGIANFFVFPFIDKSFNIINISKLSSGITTLTFAVMSLNWYYVEKIKEIINVRDELKSIFGVNNKINIIDDIYLYK